MTSEAPTEIVKETTEQTLGELDTYINGAVGESVLSSAIKYGELNLTIAADNLLDVTRFLRDDSRVRFISLIDICGVDYPDREKRFEVVYHFLSPQQNVRIRVKLAVAEGEALPSLTGIFHGANWFEREAYDMYGILFTGHPDLRRILTDYGFDGYPLRKDFPLTGYVEVRYDDELKRVVYEPVELRQEFRNFDFLSPWEGTDYDLPGDEKAEG